MNNQPRLVKFITGLKVEEVLCMDYGHLTYAYCRDIPPVYVGDDEVILPTSEVKQRVVPIHTITKMSPGSRCDTYIAYSKEVMELLDEPLSCFKEEADICKEALISCRAELSFCKEELDKIKSYTFIQRLKFLFKGEV